MGYYFEPQLIQKDVPFLGERPVVTGFCSLFCIYDASSGRSRRNISVQQEGFIGVNRGDLR